MLYRIVAMRRLSKVYALGLLIACIVTIFGYVAIWPDSNVTVYDNKFQILDYSISRGMTHTFYNGNQTIGLIRAKLRHQFGLKFVGRSPSTSMMLAPGSFAFLLRYRGDFPFEELDGLTAVLTNGKNITEELRSTKMYDKAKQTFIGCYLLAPVLVGVPTNDDSFRIDFTLESANEPVATWRVGELNKYNKGLIAEL